MKRDTPRILRWTCHLAAAFLAALPASGEPPAGHEHHRHAPPAADSQELGAMAIPDTVLVDQDGRRVRFYSDLVAGRVVAMNFIFTTCTTICPPMGANFAKLQKLLGERAAGVEMISVSVDPVVDTPQRLKAWGDRFGRRSGGERPRWTLVTGSKRDVDDLLKALEVFTPDKSEHSPIVLLGDDARGGWTRAYGLAPPARLAEMLGEWVEAPPEGGR